ncbi:hypothetical protein CDL15_Pgr018594 [Punica granatum]|uniref:Uncharacterized protein n=1 Tax=Punica granatum TaxID=22663 RepID=A0A218WYR3_PUNGR|nr:hypothetical protein CDL15_Pgr018594 [Punica granatum]
MSIFTGSKIAARMVTWRIPMPALLKVGVLIQIYHDSDKNTWNTYWSGYGRTNPLATPQHQDSLRAQGAGSVDAAHLQVDGVAANSTCEESSRLVLDPDPDPDGSTLAYEGLNEMEDDFPKVDFQPPDGVILVGRVGEEDEGTMAIDELANHTWPDPGAGMSAMEC